MLDSFCWVVFSVLAVDIEVVELADTKEVLVVDVLGVKLLVAEIEAPIEALDVEVPFVDSPSVVVPLVVLQRRTPVFPCPLSSKDIGV